MTFIFWLMTFIFWLVFAGGLIYALCDLFFSTPKKRARDPITLEPKPDNYEGWRNGGGNQKPYYYKERGRSGRYQAKSECTYQADKLAWTTDFLLSLEWKVFEDVCAQYLRLKDLKVSATEIGKDGGIDLKVFDKVGLVAAIGQCKAWKGAVGVKEVRELYGIMASEKVGEGIYFTTSFFTQDALAFASGKRLVLVGGHELVNKINALPVQDQHTLNLLALQEHSGIPTCPRCNIKMVRRQGRFGDFWGCRNYPRCRNTLQVRP